MIWDALLNAIGSLPDNAPDWNHIERFFEDVRKLHSQRHEAKRAKVESSWRALHDHCANQLMFFNADLPPALPPILGAEMSWDQVSQYVEELRHTLLAYRDLDNAPRDTIEQVRQHRQRATDLENAAVGHIARLKPIGHVKVEVAAARQSLPQQVASEVPASRESPVAERENAGTVASRGESLLPIEVIELIPSPAAKLNLRRAVFLGRGLGPTSIEEYLRQQHEDITATSQSETPVRQPVEATSVGRPDAIETTLGAAVEEVRQYPPGASSNSPALDALSTDVALSDVAAQPVASQVDEPTNAVPSTLHPRDVPAAKWIDRAAWQCLADQRPGIAYHLLSTTKRLHPGAQVLEAALAAVATLSPSVRSDDSPLAIRLASDWACLGLWLEQTTHPDLPSCRLLALTAALVPTLLAPSTGAWGAVQSIHQFDHVWPELGRIRTAVEQYASQRVAADALALAGAHDHATWKSQLGELCREAARWRQEQAAAKVIYAPTTNVWREWLKDSHDLGRALAAMIAHTDSDDARIQRCIQTWSDERQVDRQLVRTDAALRGATAKRQPIEARAKNALRKRVAELVALLQRWLSLRHSEPTTLAPTRRAKISELREGVLSALDGALAELDRVAHQTQSESVMPLAARAARRQIEAMAHLLTGQLLKPVTEPSPDGLLQRDLAFAPGVSSPVPEGDIEAAEALQRMLAAAQRPLSLQDAFNEQAALGNHDATAVLITMFEQAGLDAKTLSAYRDQQAEGIDRHRLRLREHASQVEQAVRRATCSGLLNEAERLQALHVVENTKAAVRETSNAAPFYAALGRIQEQIKAHTDRRQAEIRQRLGGSEESPIGAVDREKIEEVLRRGDFDTADELVELVIQGQPLKLDNHDAPGAFDRFFPSFQREISAMAEKGREVLPSIIEAVASGQDYGPVRTRMHTPLQRRSGQELLEAWRKLKLRGARDSNCVRDLAKLFDHIGFITGAVTIIDRSNEQQWLANVDCRVINDQRTCIVPDFGSKAEGRYLVLAVHGRPGIDDLAMHARRAAGASDRPLIVLCMDRLSELKRRQLTEATWGKRPFLLVDECLIAFLASEPSGRLASFFQCSFPFASHQPYNPTATYVPVELFFGRHREYEEVFRTDGTCLVYGGRQLGKSVLLREVARREHDVSRGTAVVWIDLKRCGVGIDKPPAHLWTVIGETLHREGVLESSMTSQASIRKRLKEWLDGRRGRRVLLLLDEADDSSNRTAVRREGPSTRSRC
jgi:hypothetical protein